MFRGRHIRLPRWGSQWASRERRIDYSNRRRPFQFCWKVGPVDFLHKTRLHDPHRSTKVCQRFNPLWTSNFIIFIFILHWITVRPITYISSYIGLGKFTEMGLQALTAACQSTPAASCGIAVTCFTCQCRKKLEFVAAHRQER